MPNAHAGRQKTFRVLPEDEALFERITARYPTVQAAVMAGFRALDGANDIDLPLALERAAAMIRAGDLSAKPAPLKPAPKVAQDPAAKAKSRFSRKTTD